MNSILNRLQSWLLLIAAVTAITAHNLLALGGFKTVPLFLSLDTDDEAVNKNILKSLGEISSKLAKVETIEKSVGEQKTAHETAAKALADVQVQLIAFQRQMASIRSARVRRGGEVSIECGKHLGAIGLCIGIQRGKLTGDFASRAATVAKDILGIPVEKALAVAEIPLPTEYAGEIVELVSEYGQARRYCTVYPAGGGTFNLPKLKTSPAFGLIAMSAAAGEKKPALEFVEFVLKKWGGLVILPNELDEDSIVGLGQFIARYAAREMAKMEDVVVFTADGTATYGSLKGLLVEQDAAATRVVMAAGKTKISDATLANLRAMRAKVATAVLGRSAYYFHPSMEQLLCSFNSAGDKPYIANGLNGASLDGFPIRWVDTFPVYSEDASIDTVFGAFGDLTFLYLATRGGMRFDTSKDFAFSTDEIVVRALERFTIGHMAEDYATVVKTAHA